MIRLIKNVTLFGPDPMGKKDVLLASDKIAQIEDAIDVNDAWVEVIDGEGAIMIPGLIDAHVHLLGGGGEGGFATRTPEIMLTDLIRGGVTTVVGCLGTDGVTRHMESLVAKAKALTEEGITAYVYTGSYRLPLQTLTGSIQKDIMMVDPIVGIGEIALSDHRSSAPTVDEFARAAADARVGGILSGKAGLVNVHLGDGKDQLDFLTYMMVNTELPASQFLPTHANRNRSLFNEAIAYAKQGGYIDFTTSTVPKFLEEGEVKASDAYQIALEKGVDERHMTFSSDGQGSLPLFDDLGRLIGLDVGRVTSLYESVLELVKEHQMPLSKALYPVTINPAHLLKLKTKGRIAVGYDADLILIGAEDYQMKQVIAKGKTLFDESGFLVKGTFEK